MAIYNLDTFVNSLPKSKLNLDYIKRIAGLSTDYSTLHKLAGDTTDLDAFINKADRLYEDESYKDMSLKDRIRYIRNISTNNDLDWIITAVTDDVIVYDDTNKFLDFSVESDEFTDAQETFVKNSYKKILTMLNWDSDNVAWDTFKQFLIDGTIAYEIVYEYSTKEEIEKQKLEITKKINGLLNEIRIINENKDPGLKEKQSALLLEKQRLDKEKSRLDLFINNDFTKLTSSSHFKHKFSEISFDNRIPVGILAIKPVQDVSRLSRVYYNDPSGKQYKLWKYTFESGKFNILPDNAIVIVSWNSLQNNESPVIISYAERLIKNYNIQRSLENSKVAWTIMNSQFKMKFIIPVSGTLTDKVKQRLREISDENKQELQIDDRSGEIKIDGKRNIPWTKNITMPNRSGNRTEIESIKNDGYDMSNMEIVNHFYRKLKNDSLIPHNRFEQESSSIVLFKGDGVPYEEVSYYRFINRLRNGFKNIILKPLLQAVSLEYPEFKLDYALREKFKFKFNSYSYYESARKYELLSVKMDMADKMFRFTDNNNDRLFDTKAIFVDYLEIFTEDEYKKLTKLDGEPNE